MKARILVVEDRPEYLEEPMRVFADDPTIQPIIARSYTEAIRQLRRNFVVASFVDLFIANPKDKKNGDDVLRWLARWRPTSRRVLCTERTEEGVDTILEVFDPEH